MPGRAQLGHGRFRAVGRVVLASGRVLAAGPEPGRLGTPAVGRRAADGVRVDSHDEARGAGLLDLDRADAQARALEPLAREAWLPVRALRVGSGALFEAGLLRAGLGGRP